MRATDLCASSHHRQLAATFGAHCLFGRALFSSGAKFLSSRRTALSTACTIVRTSLGLPPLVPAKLLSSHRTALSTACTIVRNSLLVPPPATSLSPHSLTAAE